MNKKISLAFAALIAVVGVFGGLKNPRMASAVPIEGQTPNGGYQSVGVSTAGYLFVQTSSGVTQDVAIVAPNPVPVVLSSSSISIVAVQGSTVATTFTGQTTVTTSAGVCYPAAATRKQGVLCNSDPTATVWVGGPGVTSTTGVPLLAGACLSPDVPASFIGPLSCVSSATLTNAAGFIYFTPP